MQTPTRGLVSCRDAEEHTAWMWDVQEQGSRLHRPRSALAPATCDRPRDRVRGLLAAAAQPQCYAFSALTLLHNGGVSIA
jgi:hypothetical protein